MICVIRTRKSGLHWSEKYTALHDAYISVVEALKHGGIPEHATIDIKWVDSEELNVDNVDEVLGDVNGILVPGGFGLRGVEE